MQSNISYYSYPKTETPPTIADDLIEVFRKHESKISTVELSQENSLSSDQVLKAVRSSLEEVGFTVESGKAAGEMVHRPIVFGQNGTVERRHSVDGYHEDEKCVIEVEAGRAWDSKHVHRNLIRAMTMAETDILTIAVPVKYKHSNGSTPAFNKTQRVVEELYRSERVDVPFQTVVIGY